MSASVLLCQAFSWRKRDICSRRYETVKEAELIASMLIILERCLLKRFSLFSIQKEGETLIKPQ